MPRVFTRPARPLYRRPTTPSLYLFTPVMSMPSSDVRTPNCSLSRVWSAISAACSRALVGMHPRCRHVPPTLSFSTMAMERSSSAARSAAAYPPLPAPRTTTSYTFSPLPEVTVDSDTGRSLAFLRIPAWYLPRRVCPAGLPTPSCHSFPAFGALPPRGNVDASLRVTTPATRRTRERDGTHRTAAGRDRGQERAPSGTRRRPATPGGLRPDADRRRGLHRAADDGDPTDGASRGVER